MKVPFLGTSSSATPCSKESPEADQVCDAQACRCQIGEAYANMEIIVSPLRRPEICRLEWACSTFHHAHATVGILIDSGAEVPPEFWRLRDDALRLIRSLPARTRTAVREKHRVLQVMRDWLAVGDSQVAAFAIEVAAEAVALLDAPSTCQDTDGPGSAILSTSGERRKPRLWFVRPRQTPDTPFAS